MGRAVLRIVAPVLATLVLAAWSDAPQSADKRLDEAVRLNCAGDTAGALRIAEEVLASEPANARAWNVRGWIRLGEGRLDEADADLASALRLVPHYAAAAGNRGLVCERRSDQLGAEAWYGRALRSDPDGAEWLTYRGILRESQGRSDLARKDLERATQVAPDFRLAWSHLGWLEQSESNWSEALACYRRALEIDPADAWTLSARARCLAERGDLDAALDDVERSARANPSGDASLVAFDVFATGVRGEQVARDRGILGGVPIRLRRAEIEAIRGLRFRAEVPLVAVTRAAAAAATTAGMDAGDIGDAAERRRAQTRGLARLGLVRASSDLVAARAEVRRCQTGGYYDPALMKLFVVAAEGQEPEDPSVVPHELVHALQDQHFALDESWKRSLARQRGDAADEDLELATRMVVEGEATFVQSLWTHRRSGFGAEQAVSITADFAQFVRSQEPLWVARQLMLTASAAGKWSEARFRLAESIEPYALVHEWAPYLQGLGFVERVWANGGWAGVAALYEDPPRTTEQCLHPERFVADRDEPTPLLFASLAPPGGWTESDRRVLGELNASLLLCVRGAAPKVARTAAAGWDGDLLHTWSGPEGRTAVVWATTWDTEDDAAEFASAMRAVLTARYPQAAAIAETAAARPPESPDAPPAWTAVSYDCGDTPDSRGRTVHRGREVFLVEGLPEADVQRIVDALLRAEIAHVE